MEIDENDPRSRFADKKPEKTCLSRYQNRQIECLSDGNDHTLNMFSNPFCSFDAAEMKYNYVMLRYTSFGLEQSTSSLQNIVFGFSFLTRRDPRYAPACLRLAGA